MRRNVFFSFLFEAVTLALLLLNYASVAFPASEGFQFAGLAWPLRLLGHLLVVLLTLLLGPFVPECFIVWLFPSLWSLSIWTVLSTFFFPLATFLFFVAKTALWRRNALHVLVILAVLILNTAGSALHPVDHIRILIRFLLDDDRAKLRDTPGNDVFAGAAPALRTAPPAVLRGSRAILKAALENVIGALGLKHGPDAQAHDTDVCILCYTDPPALKFLPCGHKLLCADCAPAMLAEKKECPMCSIPILDTVDESSWVAFRTGCAACTPGEADALRQFLANKRALKAAGLWKDHKRKMEEIYDSYH